MQPARAALPTFYLGWGHAVTAPERWQWHLGRKPFAHRLKLCFENVAGLDNGALMRRPRTYLAVARTRFEIGGRFRSGNRFGGSGNMHLTLELRPKECQ